MCLRFDDDLVTRINGSHAGVALYHAFGCRHLRGFIVGAVALADRAFATFAIFWVGCQPLPQLCDITFQTGDALNFFGKEVRRAGLLRDGVRA